MLAQRLDVLGRDTEEGQLLVRHDPQEPVRFRIHRLPVGKDDGGARAQRHDQPVPHHPPGGGVVADTITRCDVEMDALLS